uniref:Retrotransposon protein, putative, Ty3-gypsy subclass n=2 Tax=Oryza sativa subsp. japonica TaxID=39947 RepID=Q7G272_ORYSJ|nr:hypothetical protein [Oryza sativa Japonica Group]AAM94918.1 hypothetical protein [Oryza sativa Japonica Group]AAP54561.1 retrotransposon, putative, centromere-specific [Oryza sativa Japonica Group]
MAGLRKTIGGNYAQGMRSDQHDLYEISDAVLAKIKSALPYFEGNYDPHAYINWELAVDSEFQKHVLSEKQKEVHNHGKEERDMNEPPIPLFTLKVEALPSSEEGIKGKLNGAEINQAREYLMESSRSPLSNGSSLIAKIHLSEPQLKQQSAVSPVMGLWACNFVWDPGPSGAHVGNKVDLHRQDQQPTERYRVPVPLAEWDRE